MLSELPISIRETNKLAKAGLSEIIRLFPDMVERRHPFKYDGIIIWKSVAQRNVAIDVLKAGGVNEYIHKMQRFNINVEDRRIHKRAQVLRIRAVWISLLSVMLIIISYIVHQIFK